jgi:hypothetical protein
MSTSRSLKIKSLTIGAAFVVAMLTMTVSNSFAAGGSWARADPEPYTPPGTVDCVALTDIAEVASVQCKLFDDVNCPVGPDVECAIGSDTTATAPPTFSDVPGECGNAGTCEEYRVTFDPVADGADVTPQKELHFKIYFLNSDGNLISEQSQDIQIHSFLVIPESPIGMIAIVGAALAGLGGFYLLRGRNNAAQGLTKI